MNFTDEEAKLIQDRAKKGMMTPFSLSSNPEDTLIVMPWKLYSTLLNRDDVNKEIPDSEQFEKLKKGLR